MFQQSDDKCGSFVLSSGVLDPLELSVISGASCREGLPFISEDTSGGSLLPLKPVNLQNLEFNLVKERQDEDLVKDMKKDSSASKVDHLPLSFTTSTSVASALNSNPFFSGGR